MSKIHDNTQKDYYAILELAQTATISKIKQAFRRLALQYHPDKNPNGEAHFKQINQAYETLSNPITKKEYDDSKNQRANYSKQQPESSSYKQNPNSSDYDYSEQKSPEDLKKEAKNLQKEKEKVELINQALRATLNLRAFLYGSDKSGFDQLSLKNLQKTQAQSEELINRTMPILEAIKKFEEEVDQYTTKKNIITEKTQLIEFFNDLKKTNNQLKQQIKDQIEKKITAQKQLNLLKFEFELLLLTKNKDQDRDRDQDQDKTKQDLYNFYTNNYQIIYHDTPLNIPTMQQGKIYVSTQNGKLHYSTTKRPLFVDAKINQPTNFTIDVLSPESNLSGLIRPVLEQISEEAQSLTLQEKRKLISQKMEKLSIIIKKYPWLSKNPPLKLFQEVQKLKKEAIKSLENLSLDGNETTHDNVLKTATQETKTHPNTANPDPYKQPGTQKMPANRRTTTTRKQQNPYSDYKTPVKKRRK